MPINRITLFKIPKADGQEAALAAYAKLAAENKKVRGLIDSAAYDLPYNFSGLQKCEFVVSICNPNI
jgi:hypothetical protein